MSETSQSVESEDSIRRFKRLLDSDEASSPEDGGALPLDATEDLEDTRPSRRSSAPVPPPPPLGDMTLHGSGQAQRANPEIGTLGMPVLRRMGGSASQPARKQYGASSVAPTRLNAVNRQPSAIQPSPAMNASIPAWRRIDWRVGLGCALRMAILGVFALAVLAILGGSFVLYEYYKIAATLPSVADLRQRASVFETTRIFDRDGNLLYEILDPNAGRRTYVTLDKISPYLVAATIATEDKSFYSHPGFDPMAILRAFSQNYRSSGDTVSGASTITQQLARNLLFSPEERSERSYLRKVREALLAAEITRRYTKDEILELYLNEIYYGNLAYGIQAAAETYFGASASDLTLSQASFLAGLPQAPSVYDVYHNRVATRQRQTQVLTLMYQASLELGCIYVSNNPQKICVGPDDAVAAFRELENYQFKAPQVLIRYPHWVHYVRSILESQFDPQTIYRSGFSVYTTLDPELQDAAQESVSAQIASLQDRHVTNGALVAIQPGTGEILAMVGSADFYNEEIDGQVNMAVSQTRQPGSSIKPVTYLAAFEKGWTPATLIWDVPSEYPPSGNPADTRPPYKPVNYDERFHGPVTVRSALANSYNVPAVKTLNAVGIYDNPEIPGEDGMLAMARRLGLTSLTRPDYGLSLTLGGGEVSLLEMTGVYAVLANGGRRIAPVAITRITDHDGNLVYQYQPPAGEQVIRAEHAYLISSILSDNAARTPAFGADSILNLPFQVAAKTGTTNDFIDNWTLGYTPDLAVGVWVGNADYTPMQNTTGLTGAAPIWAEYMQFALPALTGGNPSPFFKPASIIERIICSVSGAEPSQWCPEQRTEYFAADQLPLPKEQDLWMRVVLDTWSGLRASSECNTYTKETFAMNVTDPWAMAWIRDSSDGRAWAEEHGFQAPVTFAPPRECRADDPHPAIEFTSLSEGQTILVSPVDVFARVDASANFKDYSLRYGIGDSPTEWHTLAESSQIASQPAKIYTWNLNDITIGVVTLQLYMRSIADTYAEKLLRLNLQVATPTPTQTETFTPTPTFTVSPTSRPSLTPSLTVSPTPPVTGTPPPPSTPQPSLTPLPTDTPGVNPSPTFDLTPHPRNTPTP